VHLLFFSLCAKVKSMQETAVCREQTSPGDRVCHGLIAGLRKTPFARKNCRRILATQPACNRWMREIARAIARLKETARPTTHQLGRDQLSKGSVRRMYLARGGKVCCRTGKVWMTVDHDGQDIVLTACQSHSFPAGVCVLVEALTDSRIWLAPM
jgi:hypothetical protein